ncbi:hypothetical protein O6H91_08G080000 [Diphasiastrum complanatum]|uniref:Uncharacterized protein n=1 Tax=Diphasiastrum complanatum TaxID=34168 RepID=A0ACC2CZ74_DIPCM|nr:hypothetical protein O6H91_08G080000 [Diphasiastrum complanatum]
MILQQRKHGTGWLSIEHVWMVVSIAHVYPSMVVILKTMSGDGIVCSHGAFLDGYQPIISPLSIAGFSLLKKNTLSGSGTERVLERNLKTYMSLRCVFLFVSRLLGFHFVVHSFAYLS